MNNFNKRLKHLEEITPVAAVDNSAWIADPDDKREIVTVGRHWHYKDEV